MAHIHLIGIGGTGLSAIARVLLEQGHTVSGSDQHSSPLAQAVEQAGARLFIGHRAENITGADQVVRSSAIPDHNVEVQAARQAGIPVLKRVDFLGQMLAGRRVIAVAGSHGKTTTTAMIAWMLTALGQQPGFIVGSVVANLGVNARAGQSPLFVIEADEYDYMFLGLTPSIAVITNVEHDHPDLFPTPEIFEAAFRDFAGRLLPGGVLLACADDPGALRLCPVAEANGNRAFTYAMHAPQAVYRALRAHPTLEGGFAFELAGGQGSAGTRVALQIPGRHNVQNGLAALAVADQLGLPLDQAAQALAEFRGTGRRFEVIGEAGGVTVIDDYAHHPTEIRATLAAAKACYPGRPLWALWQPHTYSRVKTLFKDFADSFFNADHVLVTEVYRAREPFDPDFSARQILPAMRHPAANFAATLEQAASFLVDHLPREAVLVVLSAGDANQISAQVLAGLAGAAQE